MEQIDVPVRNHKQADKQQHQDKNLQLLLRVAVQAHKKVRESIRNESQERIVRLPRPNASPMSTEKKTANVNPIKARDCGVFRMNDFVSAGRETKKTSAARISSI